MTEVVKQISKDTYVATDDSFDRAEQTLGQMMEVPNGATAFYTAQVMIECAKAICIELAGFRVEVREQGGKV